MSGIQISGLVSGINWNNIISELVTADSAGINQVKAQQATVNSQVSSLGSLGTDLTNLSSSVFSLEDPSLYSGVTATSTTSGSTWGLTAADGTPLGNYSVDVSTLATASQLQGAAGLSSSLSATSDVSGLTLASLPTAQAVTAGTFTVNGHQLTVTTTESLQDVFSAIASATSGDAHPVTASYNPSTDKVTLSSAAPITLGAANDTSNLLQALKLTGNNADAITSSGALGTLQLNNTIAHADLKTALTGQDGSGNGSFTINGVAISYNLDTDSLGTLLSRINNSNAGVTASYDANDDRVVLTNNSTGDVGITAGDTSGNLLSALGVTGGTLAAGVNAQFSVNGGPTQTSQSNTLTASALGVTGLSITADTTGTQTINVASNTSAITTAIQTFITDFNQLQTDITNDTQINTGNGTITTSILSSDHEVGDWASTLQTKAFNAGSGLTGSIKSLDALGIDFNGTTGQLSITDSAKLQNALTQTPAAVAAFFQTAQTGFGSIMSSTINDIISQNTSEQQTLQSQSSDLGAQITTMQNQLNAEQSQLETEFQAMESMLSQMQSESSTLSSMYSGTSSTSSSNLSTAVNSATTSTGGTSSAGTTGTSGTTSTSSSGTTTG
jgi:flagellar hook-associated protein 2